MLEILTTLNAIIAQLISRTLQSKAINKIRIFNLAIASLSCFNFIKITTIRILLTSIKTINLVNFLSKIFNVNRNLSQLFC